MSTLANAILHLYPNANPSTDYRIEDKGDGQGLRVTFWSDARLGPQPSQATIDQARLDWQAARDAAALARQQEHDVLDAARQKLASQDLTAAELRAVLRIIIRRLIALQTVISTLR
jgi:hypothetical protein